MELIRRFPPDPAEPGAVPTGHGPALSGKSPMVTSALDDVFLTADDGVWFLDILEGRRTREWDSPQSLQDVLNTQDGQDARLDLFPLSPAAGLSARLIERFCQHIGLTPADANASRAAASHNATQLSRCSCTRTPSAARRDAHINAE